MLAPDLYVMAGVVTTDPIKGAAALAQFLASMVPSMPAIEMASPAAPVAGPVTMPAPDATLEEKIAAQERAVAGGLRNGAKLPKDRYIPYLEALVKITEAGEGKFLPMLDLAAATGVEKGTIRAMNTKMSIRIGRHLKDHPEPALADLWRNLDAFLFITWDYGNPSYRLTKGALPAVKAYLANLP